MVLQDLGVSVLYGLVQCKLVFEVSWQEIRNQIINVGEHEATDEEILLNLGSNSLSLFFPTSIEKVLALVALQIQSQIGENELHTSDVQNEIWDIN